MLSVSNKKLTGMLQNVIVQLENSCKGVAVPKKSKLLEKLLSKPASTSFAIRELDALMKQCGCEKFEVSR